MTRLSPGVIPCLLAVCLALVLAPALAAATPGCVVYGDIDLDGQIRVEDLLLLMDWLDGAPPPMPLPGTPPFLAADLNTDLQIDWNDFFLLLDYLNGVIHSFPAGNSVCLFPFAGFDWQAFDVSTYVNPAQYIPLAPEDVEHSEAEVGINSHDEYVFRGVKTSRDFPESAVVFTVEMWQTGMFHWQSFAFDAVLPYAALGYFNWDRLWSLDTQLPDGTSVRHSFNLTPGGAQLNAHYFARFEYDPATHQVVFSFRKDAEAYQEVFRGASYWGRTNMESLGETRPWGEKVGKLFLLSSDGYGTAHYRLACQGSACPAPGQDQSAPLIEPLVTGTAGAGGWYTSNVNLAWTVNDPESGVTSSTGCGNVSLTGNTTGAGYTCSATNGAGLTATKTLEIKVDKDPPAITPTVSGTLNSSGWYVSNVLVEWSVSDPTSGVASSSGCTSTTLTTSTPGTTVTCTAANGAGLTAASPVTIRIDKSAPAITSNLIARVSALAYLNSGTKNSLTSKLENALASLARGDAGAARNQLQAFINEVQAQAGKKLTGPDAAFLISQALAAQAAIP